MGGGTGQLNRQQRTFKTFTPSLLKKAFLLAVVGDMTSILLDLSYGINLKSSKFSYHFLVKPLKRREVDFALDLTLDENCTVLSHLLLLE